MIGDPISVPAHYGLARAYALSGGATKAREGYRKFLAVWKDADLDLPVMKEARE